MQSIRIIKWAGETGLRKPGTICEVSDLEAGRLIERGLAVIAEAEGGDMATVTVKEDKTPLETKEMKQKRSTKTRK